MLKNTQEHKDNDYEIVVIYERVPRSYPAQLESVNVAKELIFSRHGINVHDQSVNIHEIVVKHNGVRLSARKEQKFWNKIHSMQGNGCSVQPYPSVKDIQTEQLLKIVAIDQFKQTETSFRPVLSAIKLPNQLSEAIPKKIENEKLSYFVTDELISGSITDNYLEAFQIMNTRHKSRLNHFELTRNLNPKDLLAYSDTNLKKLTVIYPAIDKILSWAGNTKSFIENFSEYQQSRLQSKHKNGEIFYKPTSMERLTDLAIASSKVWLLNLVDAYAYQMITQPVIQYAFLKYAVPLVIAGPIPVALSVGIDTFIIISNIAFSQLTSKFIYTPLENKFWECYEHFSTKTSKIWRGQTALKNLIDNRYPFNSYSIQLRMEELQEDHAPKSKVLLQNLNLSCLNFTPKIIKPLSLQWSANGYNDISWLHDDKPISFTKNLIANNQFLPFVDIALDQSYVKEPSVTQQQDNKIKIQIKPTINPIQVLVPKLEQSTKSRESRGNLVIEKNNQGNLQYQLTINDPIKHPIFSTVLITAHYLLKQLPYWFSSDKRKAQLNLEAALKKLKNAEQGDWFNFEKLFSFKTKEQLIEQRHDEVCHELTNFINVFHDQKDLQVQALAMRHSLIHNKGLLKELPDLTNIYAFYFEHFQKLHQDFSRFFAFGPKANEIANKMVKEFPFIPESHIAYAKTLLSKDPILAKRHADEAERMNIEINKLKTINFDTEQMRDLSVVKIATEGNCFMLDNVKMFRLNVYRIAALEASEQDKAQEIKEYKDLLNQYNIINTKTTAIDDSLLLEIEDPIALVNHTNQTSTLLSKGNAVVSQIQTIDTSKQIPVDIKNNPHEWIDTFKHYLVTHPNDLEARIGLMSTHYLAGNYAAVFEEATQLQKQKCTDDRIYLMLGLCYLQEGKLEKAKQQLALGHDANPNNSEIKRLLGAIEKQLILIRCQQISMVLQLGVEIAEIGFNFVLARQYHQLITAQTTMKVYLPVPRNKEIRELSCLAFFPNQKSDRQVQQNKTTTDPLPTIEQSSSASFFQSRGQPRPTLASRTGADLLIAAQTVDTTRPRRNKAEQVVSSNQLSSTSFFRPSSQPRSTSSSKAGADLLIAAQTVNTTQPRHNKAERFTSFI